MLRFYKILNLNNIKGTQEGSKRKGRGKVEARWWDGSLLEEGKNWCGTLWHPHFIVVKIGQKTSLDRPTGLHCMGLLIFSKISHN